MNTRSQKLALLAAATLVAAGCSNNDYDDPKSPMNAAPTIGNIASVITSQDTVVGPLEFSVSDDATAANMLTVTARLDGATPFPADGVRIAGDGTMRSVTLTPLESATGTANVTLTVTDAQGLVAARTFAVTVNPRGASVRDAVLTTFAKTDADAATTLNGFTFAQDADDADAFAQLLGDE